MAGFYAGHFSVSQLRDRGSYLLSIAVFAFAQPSFENGIAWLAALTRLTSGIILLDDYECKCVQLYDGWFVAYAARGAITICWFSAASRRLRS